MKNIDSVSLIMKTSSSVMYRVVKLYTTAVFVVAESTKLFKILRKAAESCTACDKNCNPKECASFILNTANTIRDGLASSIADFKTLPVTKPIAMAYDYILTDWDDFVVDLTISSDPEVDNAIGQLINVL